MRKPRQTQSRLTVAGRAGAAQRDTEIRDETRYRIGDASGVTHEPVTSPMPAQRPSTLLRASRPALRPPRVYPRRHESTGKGRPIQWKEDVTEPRAVLDDGVNKHTAFTLDFFYRFLKFTAIGLFAVGATTGTAFGVAHMWVENVALAPETDEEARRWEWDIEAERPSGGAKGGTDPGLGFRGRMAVRSAWMAQNWGTGLTTSVMGSKAYSARARSESGSLSAVPAQLEYAQDFLSIALNTALGNPGKVRPETVAELTMWHASVMERMGTKEGLFEARTELERVWASLPGEGIDAARVASKLGGLNHRLDDPEDALAWWARSIQLVQDKARTQISSIPPVVPQTPPSSPLEQRTLASTLVALSVFYATMGQLEKAKSVEEDSLHLLRSIRQPESFASASRPQALHALYLLHRSALLSIHLAEVEHTLKAKQEVPLQWLTRAAESSERVALALSGLPAIHPDAPESKIPHPPSSDMPLLSDYVKSPSMKKPASSLLRDSRRTAAEAWNLMGILVERTGAAGSAEKALECYERALGWAGVAADRAGGIGKASEGTLESEWKLLWASYVRVRDAVRKQ